MLYNRVWFVALPGQVKGTLDVLGDYGIIRLVYRLPLIALLIIPTIRQIATIVE